ncbi:3-dehydroquinate synthase family protein [Candidatus Pelagibacter sp.]|uniref:3-dehydroquinate synthase family protein n=1 Tax=Candidatus Pelagibacter sp. TaxID=2024849 RepID=UPI003F872F59
MKIFAKNHYYNLEFKNSFQKLYKEVNNATLIIIDKKVYEILKNNLNRFKKKIIIIKASEKNKTIQTTLKIFKIFLSKKVKRDDLIVAIGGGIIQDLATFTTSIYMRGLKWIYFPTTLLAQADSCIGGKSSINFSNFKNILGNFYPPSKIIINTNFLKTLNDDDIRSGIGEIIKVHFLSGKNSINYLRSSLKKHKFNKTNLNRLIKNSIILKNQILKKDAEDKNIRLKMNYGHTFGHSLETATKNLIPHGLAVNIGLDMANFFAFKKNLITKKIYYDLNKIINLNLRKKDFKKINKKLFFSSLKKDKKNKRNFYGFILPYNFGKVDLFYYEMNSFNDEIINDYFLSIYHKRSISE